MVDYSETIEAYNIKVGIYSKLNGDIHRLEVKVILWPLSKVTFFSLISNSFCTLHWSHWTDWSQITYRIMGYFRIPKFSRFRLKNMEIIFADFNFRGQQRPRKIISILPCENCRVGGTTRHSLDRSTGRKENLRPKYLKHKKMKDTCSLTDKQTKRAYLHSDGWIKWLFRTKQWNVCLACLLLELWKLCHTTLFAIKLFVVCSECNINANILFEAKCSLTVTTGTNTWHIN